MADVKDFPINAVIVSFLPVIHNAYLPGMLPTFFHIPAAERDDFVVVEICDCLQHNYTFDGRTIPSMTSGREVAGAIAKDYINSSIHVTPDGFPGIKSIPGRHTKEEIKKMFSEELAALNGAQKIWFGTLVRAADDAWTDPQQRGRHNAISDLQRHAVRALGLNREWLTAVKIDLVPCFACGYNVPASALICMNCKTVLKPEEYNAQTQLPAKELKKAQPAQAEK